MKRPKIHISLSVVAIVFIAACTFFIVLHNSRKRIEADIDHVLTESIRLDYEKRLQHSNYYHSIDARYNVRKFTAAPVSDQKIKEYTLKTRKGETTYTFKNGIEEQRAKMLMNQYLLEELNPMKSDVLKDIFVKELGKRGIHGAVGIAYFDKNGVCFSEGDAVVPRSAYQTPRHTLDINGRLRVQAWVDYNLSTLFRHTDNTTLWLVGQCLLVGGGIAFWIRRKRQSRPSSTLVIDMEKQELRINERLCDIRKLDLALLNIFVERVGECISREEIKQMFWRTDDNANEKMDVHIAAIRKILKAAPAYRLITVRGKGFYLSLSDGHKERSEKASL